MVEILDMLEYIDKYDISKIIDIIEIILFMCSHTNKPNIDIQQRYNLLSGSLRVLLVDISKKHNKEFNEIEKFLMCNYEYDKGAE